MGKIEINTQYQKRKISKLANASVICMIAEYGLLFSAMLFIDVLEDSRVVGYLFMILLPILFAATPVLGILSLIQIIKSKGLLYGKLRVAIAIIMSILITYWCFKPLAKSSRLFREGKTVSEQKAAQARLFVENWGNWG
jgi:hypothetical protein